MSPTRRQRNRLVFAFERFEPKLLLAANLLFSVENQPPVVDAGPDQAAMVSETIALDATVSDDGLPGSRLRELAQLAFELDQELNLEFMGNAFPNWGGLDEKWIQSKNNDWYFITPDGEFFRWDGGSDLSTSELIATLDASYHADLSKLFDAQDPTGIEELALELATRWSKLSGPSEVSFGDSEAVDTTASFSQAGAYVLQLEATDGQATAMDQVTITVEDSSGLARHWPFEEGGGSTTADLSGARHNGVLNGPAWSTDGKVGGALVFDGVNDFVDTGAWDIASNELTIAAWINADSFVGTYRDGRIISKATGDQTQDHYWMLSTIRQGSETRLRFRLKTDGYTDTLIAAGGDLSTGQWHHVAAVYDGAMMRLYLDGAEVGAMPKIGPISTAGNAPVWIGNNPSSHRQPFHGQIDDVRIYDQALKAGELSALISQTPPPDPTPDLEPEIYLEAESATLTAPVVTFDDGAASGQQYVAAGAANQGSVSFTVNIESAGDHAIWARVSTPRPSQDSLFVSIDDGPQDVFYPDGGWSDSWRWLRLNGHDQKVYFLDQGSHTITFGGRESGVGLDRIVVTNDLAFDPQPGSNQAPLVDAGRDRNVVVSATLTLDGAVSDDGLPNPPAVVVTTTWSKASGPGAVTFDDASAVDATAKFSQSGTYVLRLQANDGELTSRDTVTITVSDEQQVSGFFVSPGGKSIGNGGIDNPWDLKTALSHPAPVKPGDTIWLRAGTYRGGFTSKLTGTESHPIIVRAYPGEHVVIDTYLAGADPNVYIKGDHTHWRDMEFMNSRPHSRVTGEKSPEAPNRIEYLRRGAIRNHARGTKFINLVVHDLTNGIADQGAGSASEIYGSIIYNNGFVGGGIGYEHGIYTQNTQPGVKFITDNIVFNNFGQGIQGFGSGTIRGYQVEGNASFNNGRIDILFGTQQSVDDLTMRWNFTYQTDQVGAVDLGYAYGRSNGRLTLTNNYFGNQLRFHRSWSPVTSSNNTVYGAVTGHVPSSGIRAGAPKTGTQIFVRPNQYEAGRGHIIAFNWDQKSSIDVNLSNVLSTGDSYEVYHVYDLDNPVVTGTYRGGAIALPMQDTAAPTPLGAGVSPPHATSPKEFGAFLVVKTSVAGPAAGE